MEFTEGVSLRPLSAEVQAAYEGAFAFLGIPEADFPQIWAAARAHEMGEVWNDCLAWAVLHALDEGHWCAWHDWTDPLDVIAGRFNRVAERMGFPEISEHLSDESDLVGEDAIEYLMVRDCPYGVVLVEGRSDSCFHFAVAKRRAESFADLLRVAFAAGGEGDFQVFFDWLTEDTVTTTPTFRGQVMESLGIAPDGCGAEEPLAFSLDGLHIFLRFSPQDVSICCATSGHIRPWQMADALKVCNQCNRDAQFVTFFVAEDERLCCRSHLVLDNVDQLETFHARLTYTADALEQALPRFVAYLSPQP